jgi:hypothetical protein
VLQDKNNQWNHDYSVYSDTLINEFWGKTRVFRYFSEKALKTAQKNFFFRTRRRFPDVRAFPDLRRGVTGEKKGEDRLPAIARGLDRSSPKTETTRVSVSHLKWLGLVSVLKNDPFSTFPTFPRRRSAVSNATHAKLAQNL